MTIVSGSASDSTYHSRHARRTLGRAERIAQHIEMPGTLLDVGCNNGITSQYMLDAGKAKHVTGIELHASTVDASLLERDDFTLIEGNIVDLELNGCFDHIIYGAVHHHILNLRGLTDAIETLQKLTNHCNKHLFFETGQLGEGGRWEWQQQMRRHFRTDEEHFFYLLRSIEHLISGFDVIGSFWIHGIRRRYLRIDMKQGGDVLQQDGARISWPTSVEGPYVRSRGSRAQKLLRAEEAPDTDSPVRFWVATEEDGEYFIKHHVHLPRSADAEWHIGRQVDEDWAVQPIARVAPDDALAFTYLRNAFPITTFAAAPKATRRGLAAAVLEIFDDAKDREVELLDGVLLSSRNLARLADVVDHNPNNFLVVDRDGRDLVRVVDFEWQSTDYLPRNRIHIARILWSLGQRRGRAMLEFMLGLAGVIRNLLRFQFRSFRARIIARQPSLVSLAVSDCRTFLGRVFAAILRKFGLQ